MDRKPLYLPRLPENAHASLRGGRPPRHENAYRPHPLLTRAESCRKILLKMLEISRLA